MFGNKKNKLEEQINEVFSAINERREEFENGVANVEDGQKLILNEVSSVLECTNELANHAMLGIEEESVLIHSIDDVSRDLSTATEEYRQLTELIQDEMKAVMDLVENNKHFTSPSRVLNEAPNLLKQSSQSYEKQLDEMAEYGRRMGVMALNAAIEAGRMGDGAKQFVNASEEIRQTALAYEKAAVAMKEEVQASYEKINELEETIHRMFALLKESNMGSTRLFKKCQETNKAVANASMRDFSEDMILVRDKVVSIRNLNEEVAKCAERNQIQLCDMQEELQAQKQFVLELESDVSHLFDTAYSQIK